MQLNTNRHYKGEIRIIEIRVESHGKSSRCYVATLKNEESTCVFDYSLRRVLSELVETTDHQHKKTIIPKQCKVFLIDAEWNTTQFATATEFLIAMDGDA